MQISDYKQAAFQRESISTSNTFQFPVNQLTSIVNYNAILTNTHLLNKMLTKIKQIFLYREHSPQKNMLLQTQFGSAHR